MLQILSRSRRGLRWAMATAAIAIIFATVAGTQQIRRRRAAAELAAWTEIQRAATGRAAAAARPRLERWISDHPDHGESRILLANIELGLQHRDPAVALLQSVPESNPSWERAQIMLGRLAVRERRAADAERIFRQVADRDPRAMEARRNLLYLFGLQMRTAEAREILWQIFRINDDPQVLVELVLALLSDQQEVRALAPELELLVARTPDDPLLSRAWGMAQLYQGRPLEALPNLEAAAKSLVNDPTGRFSLAECLMMLGRRFDLEEILGPLPKDPMDAAQWWLFRGRIEESSGKPESAVESLEHSVALNPRSREAHFRLGRALQKLGRSQPADVHLARANQIEEQFKLVRREHQQARRTGLPSDPGQFERLGVLCCRRRSHRRVSSLVRTRDQARSGAGGEPIAPRASQDDTSQPTDGPASPGPGPDESTRQEPGIFHNGRQVAAPANPQGVRESGSSLRGRGEGRGNPLLLRERSQRPSPLHRRHHGRRCGTHRLR